MKYLRYALYLALFAVALTLWNKMQEEKVVSFDTPIETKTTTNQATVFPNQNPTPVINNTSDTKTEYVKEVPKSRLINVKTDVLNVDLDLTNANLVNAVLLQYRKELNGKDNIKLLDDNLNELFIAKNGINEIKQNSSVPLAINYTTEKSNYVLMPDQKSIAVTLNGTTRDGVRVTKTFIFRAGEYQIDVKTELLNLGRSEWHGNYYLQMDRRDLTQSASMFKVTSFFGVAISSKETPYKKLSFKDLTKHPLKQVIEGGWLAMLQHYFVTAWVPNKSDEKYYYYSDVNGDIISAGILSQPINLMPKQATEFDAKMYVGPKIAEKLDQTAPHLSKTVDFGWLWYVSGALFWLLKKIHGVVGNWGWSIVIVTVLIKAVFYKLSVTSYRSMAAMRKLQPKLNQLKEQYGNDKASLSKATMELYQKEKINPLGGCLPILIQIPVFIALYYVLIESVELRHAPFIFWIHDLAAKDPYYVLPILMGVSMFITQKMTPTANMDPTQAKMMLFLPVIMTVFFLTFPSGLVLYWVVNNILSLLQQWYIMRKYEKDEKVEVIYKKTK